MSILKKHSSTEKRLFEDYREEIAEANRKSITAIFFIALFCYALCFVMSLFVKAYMNLRFMYLGAIVFLLVALLIYKLAKPRDPSGYATALYGAIVLYAAFSGAFVTPDYIGVIILICLFEFPVLLLSRRWVIVVYETFFAFAYLAIIVPHKWEHIVTDEIINTLIFMIIGILTGFFFQSIRLSNIELLARRNIDRLTDELTGLNNRRKLFEYFIEYEAGNAAPYAIAMMDIDWFKAYNDTYGHLAGDHCLAKLGRQFKLFSEKNGVEFYRYGGEEFVCIVPGKPSEETAEMFNRLLTEVNELKIESKGSSFGHITLSIGVVNINLDASKNQLKTECSQPGAKDNRPKTAGGRPEIERINPETLLDHADHALYIAKETGRNKVVLFNKPMDNDEESIQ